MNQFVTSLAKVIVTKVVSGAVTLAAAIGIVVPLGESQTVAASLTLALAAGLQVAGQVALTWLATEFPWLKQLQPLVLRARVHQVATPKPELHA
jgi:hypothetical protein